MKLWNTLFVIGIVSMILIFCFGCTVKFKAEGLEYDSEVTRIFSFDGFELTDGPAVAGASSFNDRIPFYHERHFAQSY